MIEIAVSLRLNPRGVALLRRLLEKLGMTSHAKLVVLAMRHEGI